ncbi:MAG: hypothetical protein AAF764_07945 [Pseudomonadota bacterium]
MTSPAVGLLVLVVLAVETAGLAIFRARTGQGPTLASLVPFIGAGFAFGMALTAALALDRREGDTTVLQAATVGLPLIVAFLFHVWDLKRRW